MSQTGAPLGRARELRAISAAVGATAAGTGCVLVLHGAAGIGKTTLVDEAVRQAADADVQVFRAAALEMESMRPFGVISDALTVRGHASAASRRIEELLATGPPIGPAESEEWTALQFQMGEALLTLLDERSGTSPALLALEDLHWADPASLRVLGRLLHLAGSGALTLLVTMRPLPRRPELESLLTATARAGAVRLDLAPLSEDACRQLAGQTLGAEPGPRLRSWLQTAGGNPLLLTELLALVGPEAERGTDGTCEVAAELRPPSATVAVLGHLSVLDTDTIALLKVAAVLGASFSIADLSKLTSRPAADLWLALSPALTAEVLSDTGDRLAFRHDLIHQAVYDDLPLSVRKALHADAATALEAAGESPVVVAEHVLRSAEGYGPGPAERLRRAATDTLTSGAPAVAYELLQAALRALDGAPTAGGAQGLDGFATLRAELHTELGTALAAAGRPAEAEELLRANVPAVRDPDRRAAGADGLVQALMLQGKLTEAFEHARAAAADQELPDRWRARFAARASMGPLWVGDAEAAQAEATAAVEAAQRSGDRPAEIRARLTIAHSQLQRGRLELGRLQATEAAELAELDGSPAGYASMPHHVCAIALIDCGLTAEARRAAVAARLASERAGSADGLVCALLIDGVALFWSGEWDDAVATERAAVSLAEESNTAWQAEALCVLAMISCWRGVGDAASLLDQAEAAAAHGALYRRSWLAWARAVLLEARGDPELALDAVLPLWQALPPTGAAAELRVLGPYLAGLALAAGRPEIAADAAGVLDRLATTVTGDQENLADAALWSAGVAAMDPDLLLTALARLERRGRPHETARCAEHAAVALAAGGRLDEARTVGRQALDSYAELGADAELNRARAALRTAGLTMGVRGRRSRPVSGWAALTPTEAEVARLAAQRLSNPEIAQRLFQSRRTVGHHVSRVLAKLAMTSRLELVAAAERGSLDQL